MTKIFKIPLPMQGDKTVVPVEIQTDGSVSYTKVTVMIMSVTKSLIRRQKILNVKMNSLFHDITESIGEMQLQGFAKWSEGKPMLFVVWFIITIRYGSLKLRIIMLSLLPVMHG